MVFCQVRIITGQIYGVNIQYQEINKTTRYEFFERVVKDVICSGIFAENQISVDCMY